MESEWYNLREKVGNNETSPVEIANPFFKRLLIVLSDSKSRSLDIAKGYYDALASAYANGIDTPTLPISHKLDVSILNDTGLTLHSLLKHEVCLNEDVVSILDEDVYGLKQRRFLDKPKIDIALTAKLNDDSFVEYNGRGQRTVVRSVLTSPNNSTLFINLPTGCGKTLLIHALMLHTPSQKLNLVIVPTTALAIEQAQRVSEILKRSNSNHNGPYAWYGSQKQELRDRLKERLKSGTQRVLFCSPEAVRSSLLPTLFSLAKNDQLASLIIDEAHLIDQWGTGFRPDFQLLAPLVNSLSLKSVTGIKTILMSATLSATTLDALHQSFGNSEVPSIVINANFLRPEPNYSIIRTRNPQQHLDEALTQIRKLPRPIIVYATRRVDAQEWYELLRKIGYGRIGLFHGDTNVKQREDLIERWSNDDIDIMVATSAFGVGMDKSDVRSILHVAIPENIDRYYQESGRGGRDGRASISRFVYFKAQLGAAESLNNEKLISTKLGLKRWKYMSQDAEENSGILRIDLTRQHEQIDFNSKRNIAWNWKTLLLMQRAGFIKLHFSEPQIPQIEEDKMEQAIKDYFIEYRNHIDVEILEDGHLSKDAWDDKVEAQRKYEWRIRKVGLNKLKQWIDNPNIRFCDLLSSFYSIDGIEPQKACGGCQGCLSEGIDPYTPTLGSIEPKIVGWPFKVPDGLGNVRTIHYPGKGKTYRGLIHSWKHIIIYLLNHKIIQAVRAKPEIHRLLHKVLNFDGFWCAISPKDPETIWDELILIMPDETKVPQIGLVNCHKILLIPDHLKDPKYPHRKWIECDQNAVSLDDYERELKYVDNQ